MVKSCVVASPPGTDSVADGPSTGSPVADGLMLASPAAASPAAASPVLSCPVAASPVAASPAAASLVDDAREAPAPGAGSPGAGSPGEDSPPAASPPGPVAVGAAPRPAPPARIDPPARSRWPRRVFRPARFTGLGRSGRSVDMDAAAEFIRLHRSEVPDAGPVEPRLREIRREISLTGTYQHTVEELEFGARVAWRNSSRCIGRLYWKSLKVRDRRQIDTAAGIAAECAGHLRAATNHGRVRPTITVFAPDTPARKGPRIWNEQLVRYAGYQQPDGSVLGEPCSTELTDLARGLGWETDAQGRFDVLPLIVSTADEGAQVFGVPADAVTEVHLIHPRLPWFGELGLRWYAVPVICDMCLEIGGICYPAAPFNGWYMGTEIGARNLADSGRYNQLPEIAARMGLDTTRDRSLWRDLALVELNLAVLHSFETAGVTITDHHTESRRFLTHLAREERAGRVCPADWTWIVPPISGSVTGVFHRYYAEAELRPAYARHNRKLPAAPALSAGETCP
ncbi:MAG TPA: nitric oxide synthase oxygenase [Streptosporangiaceae bacterium]